MITFKEFFLLEGMKTPAELKQEQIYFIINHQNDTRIQINMYKRPQKFMFSGQLMKYNNLWVFHIQSKENELGNVYASKGYGPVMYDIAMELASKYGEGLVTPISINKGYPTDASVNVYKYYYNNRSDIQKTPLDYEKYGFEKPESLLDTSKTKQDERLYDDEDDDDGYWDRDEDDDRIKLYEHPWLTTLYVKSNPTTLNQLEANNMIRYSNTSDLQIDSSLIQKREEYKNSFIKRVSDRYNLSLVGSEKLYNDLISKKLITMNKQGQMIFSNPDIYMGNIGDHVNLNVYRNKYPR